MKQGLKFLYFLNFFDLCVLLTNGGDKMETSKLIMIIAPILLLQIALAIYALVDLRKHDVKIGTKVMWVFIVIFLSTIGPILYFLIGRKENA